ncbi:MAG: zinc-ribbon and DUF3426 domain-containing protein [Acidiferrobacterales bacterium]
MSQALHTRCPACQTTFAVKRAQLRARDGLVRCGRCSAVFRADQHILGEEGTGAKRATKPKPRVKPPHQRRVAQQPRAPEKKAPAQRKPRPDGHKRKDGGPVKAEEFLTPTLAKLFIGSQQSWVGVTFWAFGALALSAALAGQIVYFFASELARQPQLRPWVSAACNQLGCEIRPQRNVELIELVHTSIVPHPKRLNALRVRTSMVNRASFKQPFPLMEVTLTSRNGKVIARRTFMAHEYVGRPHRVGGMIPHVVVDGVLDISKPNPQPGGYEVRLVTHQ